MGSKSLNLSKKKYHNKEQKQGKLTLTERIKAMFSTSDGSLPEKKPKRKKEGVTDTVFGTLSNSSTVKGGIRKQPKDNGSVFRTPVSNPQKQGDEDKGRDMNESTVTGPVPSKVDDKLLDQIEKGHINPSKPPSKPDKARKRKFTYLEPVNHSRERREIQQPLVEIKAERVIAQRPIIETVSDINSISFMDRISLVTYYNDKKSGKLDEREALRVHKQNTELMERYYSLVFFIQEASIRALELRGEYEYTLQIDSKDRDILDDVIADSNLSSYEIEIFYENRILSRLAVEPVFLKIRLKEF